jgi:predicted nucleic acid-binding protein
VVGFPRLQAREEVNPEPVYEEVVTTGIEAGYPDARWIERRVDDDRLEVIKVEMTELRSRLQQNSNLSTADVAVLACADANDGVAVMDEQYGRDVAAAEGITTRGTAYLVLKLTKQGAISPEDAQTTIDSIIDAGWYCAPDIYTKIIQRINELH